MSSRMLCVEIIEALVRQNPGCPLLRQCSIFRSSCRVSNIIDLTAPEDVPKIPPGRSAKTGKPRGK